MTTISGELVEPTAPHLERRARPVTLKDVAALAGVDKGSVSVVLNGAKSNTGVSAATRQRILDAARELDYRPNPIAQRLATGHSSKHIDIFALKLDAGIGVHKIKAIQGHLMSLGYDVPVHSYDFYGMHADETERKLELIRALRRQRPRAIVCATPGVDPVVLDEISEFIKDGGIAVCYDDAIHIACDNVVFDTHYTIERAATHLMELGHRRIGLFQQGVESPNPSILEGFRKAHEKFALEVRPDWIFGSPRVAEEGGSDLAQQFLALPKAARPSGMVVINDRSAFGFMVDVAKAGIRIPDELSVVGHDDLAVARYCPVPLTTVTHPYWQIASTVVSLLRNRLESQNNENPRRVHVRGELVIRQSTQVLG